MKIFKKVYTPDRDICVDESLLGFKGRLNIIQYFPMKTSKRGIKFFVLCESKSGYSWDINIYLGKDTPIKNKYSNLLLTTQYVMNLLDPLLKKYIV